MMQQQQKAVTKAPRRKVSVFSHDGFPNIHQLDQTNLKQRSISTVLSPSSSVVVTAATNTGGQQAGSSTSPSVSSSTSSSTSAVSGLRVSPQPVSVVSTEAADKARRSVRSDTLGSTGSSRASSCDEPAIVSEVGSTNSSIVPIASRSILPLVPNEADKSVNKQRVSVLDERRAATPMEATKSAPVIPTTTTTTTTDTITRTAACNGAKRKFSLGTNATTSSNCSSYSSLESIGGPVVCQPTEASSTTTVEANSSDGGTTWPQNTTMSSQAAELNGSSKTSISTNSNSNSSNNIKLVAPTSSNVVPPPFESIRSQIRDGNSPPDAQLIQRHIDKLISQNEAIIDNWNLVSIRSYNSASSRGELSSAITASANNNNGPEQQQQQQSSSSSFPLKRSSVACGSMVASPISSGDLGLGSKQQQASRLMASRQGSSRPLANKQRWSTTALGNPALLIRPQQSNHHPSTSLIQRLPTIVTSSGQSSSGDIPTGIKVAQKQQQQQSDNSTLGVQIGGNSVSVPNSPRSNVSAVAFNRELELKRLQQLQEEPFGTLSGNWSAGPFGWTGLASARISTASDCLNLESAIENLSLKRLSQVDQPQAIIQTNGCGIDNMATSQTQQNLTMVSSPTTISSQQQQAPNEEHLIRQQPDELLLKLAILQHEQRQQQQATSGHQQLAAAYLHHHQQQQQFVEQQLEQLRISQQIEHHQRVARALAAVVASASSTTTATAHTTTTTTTNPSTSSMSQQYLQEHQALESQLLNEFLAKMILGQQHPNQVPLVSSDDGLSNHLTGQHQLNIGGHHDPNHNQYVSLSNGPNINGATNQANLHQLGHGTELLTQSLDSATPAHRCEACDISFWTCDLLKYHQLTQCSARTGPAPARPIAFNFSGPNGFDSIANNEQSAFKQSSNNNSNCLDGQQQLLAANPIHHRHSYNLSNHFQFQLANGGSNNNTINNSQHQQAKSVSPPRRRTTTIDIGESQFHIENRSLNSLVQMEKQLAGNGSFYAGCNSYNSASTSALTPWCQSALGSQTQVIDELSILKQQLLSAETSSVSLASIKTSTPIVAIPTIGTNDTTAAASTSIITPSNAHHGHGSLPFKKRKISEPNMR